jgi:hypothetical protein
VRLQCDTIYAFNYSAVLNDILKKGWDEIFVIKKCLIIVQSILVRVVTELFGNMHFNTSSYYEQLLSQGWTEYPAATKAGYEGMSELSANSFSILILKCTILVHPNPHVRSSRMPQCQGYPSTRPDLQIRIHYYVYITVRHNLNWLQFSVQLLCNNHLA